MNNTNGLSKNVHHSHDFEWKMFTLNCFLWSNQKLKIPLYNRINIFGMILIESHLISYDHFQVLVTHTYTNQVLNFRDIYFFSTCFSFRMYFECNFTALPNCHISFFAIEIGKKEQ